MGKKIIGILYTQMVAKFIWWLCEWWLCFKVVNVYTGDYCLSRFVGGSFHFDCLEVLPKQVCGHQQLNVILNNKGDMHEFLATEDTLFRTLWLHVRDLECRMLRWLWFVWAWDEPCVPLAVRFGTVRCSVALRPFKVWWGPGCMLGL